MPRYKLRYRETIGHSIEMEADSEEDAIDQARELISDNGFFDFEENDDDWDLDLYDIRELEE